MKINKKQAMRFCAVICALSIGLDSNAKSISYYTDKAKSGMDSAWQATKREAKKIEDSFSRMHSKAKSVADNIDPKTLDKMKKGLIGAGVVVGAAAGAAAVGYAATEYDLFGSAGAQDEQEQVLASTVNMLKNDPEYSGDVSEQFRYLLSTDMDLSQIENVIDMANPGWQDKYQ